jgi:hypothetical protein
MIYCFQVFCGKCSEYKYPLPWEEGRKGRVCRTCHGVLAANNSGGNSQAALTAAATLDLSSRPRGLLEVGSLQCSLPFFFTKYIEKEYIEENPGPILPSSVLYPAQRSIDVSEPYR